MRRPTHPVVSADLLRECLDLVRFNEELGQGTPHLQELKLALQSAIDGVQQAPDTRQSQADVTTLPQRVKENDSPGSTSLPNSFFVGW